MVHRLLKVNGKVTGSGENPQNWNISKGRWVLIQQIFVHVHVYIQVVVEIYMYPEYKRNYTIFSAADAKVWELKKKTKTKKNKKKKQVIGKTRRPPSTKKDYD